MFVLQNVIDGRTVTLTLTPNLLNRLAGAECMNIQSIEENKLTTHGVQ